MITTIQLSRETRSQLSELKENPRETYEQVLGRLLALIPAGDDEGLYTRAFRIGLLNARLDVIQGRLTDHSEVKRRLGL